MQITIWMVALSATAYVLLVTYPEIVIEIVDDLWLLLLRAVQRWRRYLVRKYGRRAFREVQQQAHALARQKEYAKAEVEEALAAVEDEFVERLGNSYVNEVFGELDLDKYWP